MDVSFSLPNGTNKSLDRFRFGINHAPPGIKYTVNRSVQGWYISTNRANKDVTYSLCLGHLPYWREEREGIDPTCTQCYYSSRIIRAEIDQRRLFLNIHP